MLGRVVARNIGIIAIYLGKVIHLSRKRATPLERRNDVTTPEQDEPLDLPATDGTETTQGEDPEVESEGTKVENDNDHVAPRIDRRRLRIFGPIIAIALIAVAVFAFQGFKKNPFEEALESCDVPNTSFMPSLGAGVVDDGKTLIVNGTGEEDATAIDMSDIACILRELEVPMSITSQMEGTRALDGKQNAEWGKYKVTWSYHPNSGMDAIFTR